MHRKSAKRKATRRRSPEYTQPDPSLHIQAHEADIIRGQHTHVLALSLEAQYADGNSGTRLIRLHASEGENAVWVDRYDARLLLDALPLEGPSGVSTPASENARLSPTGWSDLPSDAEDTFFFSPEEVEDFHREKRRRTMERGREERLRARRAEDGEDDEGKEHEEDTWGGSDEEPDDPQKELMRRTATHILSSPNPAQLEMRILANHGADRRFAFLRGRWSRAWRIAKGHTKLRLEEEKAKQEEKAGLGGLAGYASDSEEEEAPEQEQEGVEEEEKPMGVVENDAGPSAVDAVMEARRARAKEWAAKRRKAQSSTGE
ncbi:hypothetical protein BDW22DRAFT_670072 [Trametopsis cervina]|nr:hypothetical protein BDW22DRAFT_670072 [Trametopsis cervina]